MRRDFIAQIHKEMEKDENIFFITGDLGFNALENLQKSFPKRFINAGIAEQHMVGMASGMALEGKKVIAYSIASFSTMRPYEQIRDDVCYNNLDVKIIGVGGGYNYPTHGVTHHTVEDVAIMNVLPHMKVLCPGYSWEATEATKALIHTKGPGYIRLGKSPGIKFEKPDFTFKMGRGFVIKDGKEVVLLSTGNVLDVAVKTAQLLEDTLGVKVAVLSMPSIKPFDEDLLVRYAKNANGIFTIEEHSTTGGLGSVVAGILAKNALGKHFRAFGFPPERFEKGVGDRDYLLNQVGLSPEKLAKEISLSLED